MGEFLKANWLTLFLAVLTVILSVVLYRRSLRDKAMSYTWEDVVVISPADETDDDLKITYAGHDVPRVTRSRLALWNSGRATIDGEDLRVDDPLRIELGSEEDRILRVQVVKRTRDVSGGDVPGVGEKRAILRFKYLDGGDGVVVEVLHTGLPGTLRLVGSVKGTPGGVTPLDREWAGRWIISIFLLLMSPMLLMIPAIFLGIPGWFLWKAWHASWPNNAIFPRSDGFVTLSR